MAYSTSTTTSPDGLLSAIYTFATSNGWTGETATGTGGDPASSQRAISDGAGLTVALIPQNTAGEIHFQPATAFINSSTNFYAHTGTPSAAGTAGTFPKCGGIPNGSSFTYHLFCPNSAPRYIHAVVRHSSGNFTHLAFGTCAIFGTFTGGQYATALSWRSTSNTNNAFMFVDGINTSHATQWVRCDEAFSAGGTPTWFQQIGLIPTTALSGSTTTFMKSLFCSGLIDLTQRSPLTPNYLKAESGGLTVFVGQTPDLRIVSMEGRNPDGETVTIGSDEWLIFPARNMGAVPETGANAYVFTGSTPNHQSNHMGYAYRKIT